MAGIRFSDPNPQYDSDNGVRLANGSILFYVTGTSTPATTYSDADLDPGSANANPVTLNSAGRASTEIFLDPTVTYRAVLKDSDGNVIWDRDPVAGSDVTDAIAAHNADLTAHYAATESQRGFVELANDAEAQAMAATDRALTPANLAALDPLTTRPGLVERATTAEIEAGTDDERYISPLGAQSLQATSAELKAATDTLHFISPATLMANADFTALKGHVYIGKFLINWGKDSPTNGSEGTSTPVTFDEPFPTACCTVQITTEQPVDTGDDNDISYDLVKDSASTTGFNFLNVQYSASGDLTQGYARWFAVGF